MENNTNPVVLAHAGFLQANSYIRETVAHAWEALFRLNII